MTNKFDYNSEEVLKILNNTSYTDEQKKTLFENYKKDLKNLRKREIINRVNELAKNNPVITEEIYINFLKKYEDDNLSKPFVIIEKEIKEFEAEMHEKYSDYLNKNNNHESEVEKVEEKVESEEEPIVPEKIIPEEEPSYENTSTIFDGMTVENNVLNEEPEILAKPIVDDFGTSVDIMPSEAGVTKGEKGNASAIIISIIAIIMGIVVMYTIIKFN